MPKPSVLCPACGLEVPMGRFCKNCGSPLPTELLPAEETSQQELVADGQVEPEPSEDQTKSDLDEVALPDFGVQIDGIDSMTLALLLSRSELELIDAELDHMIGVIQATRQALKLTQADKAVLTRRAEELKESFESLKSRREELGRVSGEVILESILKDIHSQRKKLEKLEAAAETLDASVVREQKTQLTSRLKELDSDRKTALKVAKGWLKAFEQRLKEMDREMSRLDARHKIGEVADDSYEELRRRGDRLIRVVQGGQKRLDEMIRQAEKI
ncbi:MAG: hypothetical protein HXY34_11020 [Candidatus Thorarchaeota archaeon]|nr:hypothetical protein [Candidatus Thorarchaeota archaeon]